MNLFSNCFVLVSFAADLSKDGKWCYLVFWVVGKPTTRWSLLKNRLLDVCPSYFSTSRIYSYRLENQQQPKLPDVFLLKFWCFHDRKGLLHGTPFFLPLITFSFLQKMFSSIFVTPSFTGFFIFLHTCDRSGIYGTDISFSYFDFLLFHTL